MFSFGVCVCVSVCVCVFVCAASEWRIEGLAVVVGAGGGSRAAYRWT